MQHRCRAFELLILVATPRLHDSRALVVRRQVTRVDERLRYWTLMTWEGPCPPTGLVDQPIRTQTSVSDPQTAQRIRLAPAEMVNQPGFGKGGIAFLIDNARGRAKGRQRRHQLQPVELEFARGSL